MPQTHGHLLISEHGRTTPGTALERSPSRVRYDPAPVWIALSDGIHVRRMVDGNGCEINLYQLAKGRRFDSHHHPFAELGVMLSGRGTLLIETEERPLQEGDSFYIPGDTPHGFAVGGTRPAVLLNVTVPQLVTEGAPSPSAVVRPAALALLGDLGIAPTTPKRGARY
jgi:quercetin dioxygenase-like cupin family protein